MYFIRLKKRLFLVPFNITIHNRVKLNKPSIFFNFMLYLIGLGLNVDGISKYGLAIAKRCKKIYLENYTTDFPYSEEGLKEVIGYLDKQEQQMK